MQQDKSLVLPPGFSSQPSPPQNHQNYLTGHGNGTDADASFPADHNATSQFSFVPGTWNPTIETNNSSTSIVGNKNYCDRPDCDWPDRRQSNKEYTAGDLEFVRLTHTRPCSRR